MPIRFRCEHCGQLLGIARRKAGTEVACPKCQRQVLVPATDPAEVGAASFGGAPQKPSKGSPPEVGPPSPVFERSEFEAYLRGVEGPPGPRGAPPIAAGPPLPLPAPRPPEGASPRGVLPKEAASSGEPSLVPFPSALPGTDLSGGIFLSPTWATILTVIAILLLALAFSAGLLVGRTL